MPTDLYAEKIRIVTGSMVYTISAVAVTNPNGVVNEPSGSIIRAQDGSIWVSTGGTVWVNTGPSGLTALSGTIDSGIKAAYASLQVGTSASDAAVQVSLKAGTTASLQAYYTTILAGTSASDAALYTTLVAGSTASIASLSGTVNARFIDVSGTINSRLNNWNYSNIAVTGVLTVTGDLRVSGSITGSGDAYFATRVGIATAAPAVPLHVMGSGRFQGTDAITHLNFSGATEQDTYIRAGKFGGRVLIGDVNTGSILLGSTTNNVSVLGDQTTAGSITGSGDVSLGRKLSVAGNAAIVGSITGSGDASIGRDLRIARDVIVGESITAPGAINEGAAAFSNGWTGQTATTIVTSVSTNGTYDTTAGSLTTYGLYANAFASRSNGPQPFNQVGLAGVTSGTISVTTGVAVYGQAEGGISASYGVFGAAFRSPGMNYGGYFTNENPYGLPKLGVNYALYATGSVQIVGNLYVTGTIYGGGIAGGGGGTATFQDLYVTGSITGSGDVTFGRDLSVARNATVTGIATVNAQLLVNPDPNTDAIVVSNANAAQTDSDVRGLSITMAGTYDTTAGAVGAYGAVISSAGTRLTGSNALTNTGLNVTAGGAPSANYAIYSSASGAGAYSFVGAAGILYNVGNITTDANLTVAGSTTGSGNATFRGVNVLSGIRPNGGYQIDGVDTIYRSTADGHLYIYNPYSVAGAGDYDVVIRSTSTAGDIRLQAGGSGDDLRVFDDGTVRVYDDLEVIGSLTGSGDALFSRNVGIGAASTANRLYIAGAGTSTTLGSHDANSTVRIANSAGVLNSFENLVFGGTARAAIEVQTINTANAYGNFNFATRGTDGWQSRLFVSASGLVGIGTTAPTSKLHVIGDTLVAGSITGSGDATFSRSVGIGVGVPTAQLDVTRGTLTNGTAMFRGTAINSHFNYLTDEHTFIRGGKATSQVNIGDTNTGGVRLGSTTNSVTVWADLNAAGSLTGSQLLINTPGSGSQGVGIVLNNSSVAAIGGGSKIEFRQLLDAQPTARIWSELSSVADYTSVLNIGTRWYNGTNYLNRDLRISLRGLEVTNNLHATGSITGSGDATFGRNVTVSGYKQIRGTPTIGNDGLTLGFTAPNGIIAAKNTSGAPASNLAFQTNDGSAQNTVLTLGFDKLATFTGGVTVSGGITGSNLSVSGQGTFNNTVAVNGNRNSGSMVVSNSGLLQTIDLQTFSVLANGTFDTTAAARTNYGLSVRAAASRSLGSNAFANVAIFGNPSGTVENAINVGALGQSEGGSTSYGIYGNSFGGDRNYAGYFTNVSPYGLPYSGTVNCAIFATGTVWFVGDLKVSGTITATSVVAAGGVTSPGGTTNYVSKFTSGQVIGNSTIIDNGNSVGITTNEFHFRDTSNATDLGYINYYGYNGGITQFRNLTIANGKGAEVAYFDGSNKAMSIGGLGAPGSTLDVARGTLGNGTARFAGTAVNSHFNFSTDENTYLRGGKVASAVFVGDSNTGGVQLGATDNPVTVPGYLTVTGIITGSRGRFIESAASKTQAIPALYVYSTGSFTTAGGAIVQSALLAIASAGRVAGANLLFNVGVDGHASNSTNLNIGVRGQATGSATSNYGVYGAAVGGTNNYAGYFDQGRVYAAEDIQVVGSITGSAYMVGTVAGRMLIGRQRFTANNTYTPTAGTKAILVKMVGAGGGGGGWWDGINGGVGGGGAGGSYFEKFFTTVTSATGSLIIGTGGTGGDNATGGTGGDTAFAINGVTYVVKGGLGGAKGQGYGAYAGGLAQAGSSTGDVTVDGMPGGLGTYLNLTQPAFFGYGGAGGNSPFGVGGASIPIIAGGTSYRGKNPAGFGSGGGGGIDSSGIATRYSGSQGAGGFVLIDEFA